MSNPQAQILIREDAPGRYTRSSKGVSPYHDGEWVSPRPAHEIMEWLESVEPREGLLVYLPGPNSGTQPKGVSRMAAIAYFLQAMYEEADR